MCDIESKTNILIKVPSTSNRQSFQRHTALVGFITHIINVSFKSQFVVSSPARVFELVHSLPSGLLQQENVQWDCFSNIQPFLCSQAGWWSEGLYQSVKSFWTGRQYGRTEKQSSVILNRSQGQKMFDNSCLEGKQHISHEKECTKPYFDVSGPLIVHWAASGL